MVIPVKAGMAGNVNITYSLPRSAGERYREGGPFLHSPLALLYHTTTRGKSFSTLRPLRGS